MDLEYQSKEKIVGFFMMGIFLLLFTTLIMIGRGKDWFANYVTYYTIFDESYNLQENSAIKLFKADIGKIKDITVIENKVRVKLLILEKYRSRIRTDSMAVVESPTLIGSEYVSILPGNPNSDPLEEDGVLPSRAKRSISDFLNEFQVEKTAKMLMKAAQDISLTIEKLKDPDGPVSKTLENMEALTAHFKEIAMNLKSEDGGIGRLLLTDAMSVSLYNSIKKSGQILEDIEKALADSPKATENIYRIIASIHQITNELDVSIKTVQRILTHIETGSQNVPSITQNATQGIKEIREGVENIDRIVKSLQKSILIRPNLDPEPQGENADAGLRQ